MNILKLIGKIFPYLGWFLFILCLFLKDCTGKSNNNDIIETPVIKETLNPNTNIVHSPINDLNPETKKKNTVKYVEDFSSKLSKDNEKLKSDISEMYDRIEGYQNYVNYLTNQFENETDSLQRIIMYKNSVSLNSFTTTFEDDNLKLELNGITQGFLKEITPTYEIKSQKLPIPSSNPRLKVYIGGGIGSNFDLNQGLYKANLSLQNKKQNILRGSYMKINSENYGVLEYDFYLFKIK